MRINRDVCPIVLSAARPAMKNAARLRRRAAHPVTWSLASGFAIVFFAGCRAESPLKALMAEGRPGEARLAGAPWISPTRADMPVSAALRRATLLESSERPTSGSLHTAAIAHLLIGNVNRAVHQLTLATELAPSDAILWSDLSAAHLERGKTASDPYAIFLALAAADRAIRLTPLLPAALFNRALALERLSLRDLAASEWRHLLAFETDPKWAQEDRSRAEILSRPKPPQNGANDLSTARKAIGRGELERVQSLVARDRQSFRETIEERLLGGWAAAANAGRASEAARELAVAQTISRTLRLVGGDPMAAEVFEQIGRPHISEANRERLAAGVLAYTQGLEANVQGHYREAIPGFRKARKILGAFGNPLAHLAAFRIALCHYQNNDYPNARADLAEIIQNPSTTRYRALAGRAYLLVGLIEGNEGNYASSIEAMESSEAAFREIGEVANASKVSATLATAYDFLGRRQEAWRKLIAALIDTATMEKPLSRFSVCEYASWLAWREGESEIALRFQDEVVRIAPAINRPEGIVGALRQRAAILASLGRKSEAKKDIARARNSLQEIPETSLRRAVAGDLLLAESEVEGSAAPLQALVRLDEAIRIFRETRYHLRLGSALHQRALIELTLGRHDAAERNFTAAIAELEQQRHEVPLPQDRITYFDLQKEVFDSMVEFQLEQRHRPEQALRFSEQAKARVLWDWMGAGLNRQTDIPIKLHADDLKKLKESLPQKTALIEYSVLPGKIAIWLLRRDQLQCETVSTQARALENLIGRLRLALRAGRSDELSQLSQQAYDLLIRPVAHRLESDERLVFVPDGPLHSLPFSILRDRRTGRFLIQDHVLTIAPSARIYWASSQRDATLASGVSNVLVVAAPTFDRKAAPNLQALSAGETETHIADFFPGSRVLTGDQATREAFLQAAGGFQILYFGGHSLVNQNFPLLSQMLFAPHPETQSKGILYSGDVLRHSFPRTRLVVLASCGSALGRLSKTEGVENLARPFLAVGVPFVVASLWTVADRTTAEFFVRFHGRLRSRFDVAEALQATQIDAIEAGGKEADPRIWAAFEVVGGGRPQIGPPSSASDRTTRRFR